MVFTSQIWRMLVRNRDHSLHLFNNDFLKKCSFIFKRGRESMSGGRAERGAVRGSEASSVLTQWALWGARTHKPWGHDLSWSQKLNPGRHPGAPAQQRFLRACSARATVLGARYIRKNHSFSLYKIGLNWIWLTKWPLAPKRMLYYQEENRRVLPLATEEDSTEEERFELGLGWVAWFK